jgi:hypothetical protein
LVNEPPHGNVHQMMDVATRAVRLSRLLKTIVSGVIFGFLLVPSTAIAAGDLSSVVIVKTFPDLTASPPGALNGPISVSNLSDVIGSDDRRANEFMSQQLAGGDVSGYVRVWRHQPVNGEMITISAFRFHSLSELKFWQDGVNGEIRSLAGVATVAVPRVKGARGYKFQRSTLGTLTMEYEITFVEGQTSFLVNVVSPSDRLTSSDAVTLATRQALSATVDSSTTSENSTFVVDIVSGAAVLIGFVALVLAVRLMRKRRRS